MRVLEGHGHSCLIAPDLRSRGDRSLRRSWMDACGSLASRRTCPAPSRSRAWCAAARRRSRSSRRGATRSRRCASRGTTNCTRGVRVERLDLKSRDGMAALQALLARLRCLSREPSARGARPSWTRCGVARASTSRAAPREYRRRHRGSRTMPATTSPTRREHGLLQARACR